MPTASGRSPVATVWENARWALAALWTVSRRLTLGLTALVVVRALPPAGMAVAAKGLVDAVAAGRGGEAPPLWPWLTLAFVCMIAEALAPLGTRHVSSRLQAALHLHFASAVLDHAGRLEPAFFDSGDGRAQFERAEKAATTVLARFLESSRDTVTGAVQIVSLVVILGTIEPLALVIVPPIGLPYLLVQFRIARRRYDEERKRTDALRYTRHLAEQVTGPQSLAEVHLLGIAPLLVERFRALLLGFRDADRRLQNRDFSTAGLFAVLASVAFFAVFLRVVGRAFAGEVTLGGLAVFGGAAARLRFALTSTLSAASGALEQTLFISDLRDFLATPAERRSVPDRPPSAGVERVEFRDVVFRYPGADAPTIDGVSFTLRRGETVALVGENGAGKTTITRLLAGVLQPESGSVCFDGVDVRELPREDLQREVALLPQSPTRFEATADENIAFGDWRRLLAAPDELARIAADVGVEPLLASMPRGGATRLGRIVGEYDPSGGQWQQLGIARAYAHGGSVLILDEPSSQLDARAESQLLARLRRVAADRATLLVSHRFTTLSLADRILVLSQGRVVENGSHAELLARNGLYAQLYRLHRGEIQPAVATGS